MAALEEAGVDPEVVISEFGADQFEVTRRPSDGITASDRCVVIREIAREIARAKGWHASFAPKTTPDGVGNGVASAPQFPRPEWQATDLCSGRPWRIVAAGRGVLRRHPQTFARDHGADCTEPAVVLPG